MTTQAHLLMSWCKACRSEYNTAYQRSDHAQAKHAQYKATYRSRSPVAQARCDHCKEIKPASSFYKNKCSPNGLQAHCIKCKRQLGQTPKEKLRRRQYASVNNGKESARLRRRVWMLRKKFGITQEDYVAMYEAQNQGCAICGSCDDLIALHVDHNHQTGKVRGLLCARHNQGIGFFHDSVEEMRAAIEYLRKHD